ncbi:MAG: hypothetical protein HYV93_11605 [Candidatus Rokubacteria bacterium]|nr:hypothetical protein [Candidatus Rokubacteria bacterium]
MLPTAQNWLDPRPQPRGVALASRPSGSPRRLVCFDNGKLSPPYHRWMPILPELVAQLERLGHVTVECSDLLSEPVADHAAHVARWQRSGIDGVVFALCDAGVTLPTVQLAAAAEAGGIPTAIVCTEQVIEVAAVSAGFLAPGLPLLVITGGRLDGPDQLVAAVAELGSALRDAISQPAAELQARFRRSFPFVAALARRPASTAAEPFAAVAAREFLTDGLPVTEPTRDRVDALLATGDRDPEDRLVMSMAPSGSPLTVRQAAICAAMAGCGPECFLLVVAALRAMAAPEYRLSLASITTYPGANLLVFSGPAAQAAGVAHGRGCLGPAHRANLAIGRAVALTLITVGRAIPGLSTLCQLGSPGQIACCFADDPHGPLPPLHTELVSPGDSIVLVQKCESPHNVLDHLSSTPEQLLATVAAVAATVGGNNAYVPSDLIVILNPEHAEIVARAGWRRRDVQQFLWQEARNERSRLHGRGAKPEWPAEWSALDRVPVAPSPDRIWVVVAGAPGPHSMVAKPWGYAQAVWQPVHRAAVADRWRGDT